MCDQDFGEGDAFMNNMVCARTIHEAYILRIAIVEPQTSHSLKHANTELLLDVRSMGFKCTIEMYSFLLVFAVSSHVGTR